MLGRLGIHLFNPLIILDLVLVSRDFVVHILNEGIRADCWEQLGYIAVAAVRHVIGANALKKLKFVIGA